MKAFGLLFLLVPALSFGSVSQSVSTPSKKTYTCTQYTDNTLSMSKGFLTDNPVQEMETTIVQNDKEFIIKANVLFPDGETLSNQIAGADSGIGTNKGAMLVKQYNDKGGAYFLVYLFEQKAEPSSDIKRVLVFAACATN